MTLVQFAYFRKRKNGRGYQEEVEQVAQRQRFGDEDALKERHVDDQHLANQREADRDEEGLVSQKTNAEDGFSLSKKEG